MGWVMALLPAVLLVAGFPFFLVLLATAASRTAGSSAITSPMPPLRVCR